MTASTFVNEKRVAVQSYRKVLTGERVGPYGHDADIVPYLLELNAIPGAYTWASCAGHDDGRRGFVWVGLRYVPARPPKSLGYREDSSRVTIVYPFQRSARKVAFEFDGNAAKLKRENTLDGDMELVLEYLWGLPT